jgi:hypothetical protein
MLVCNYKPTCSYSFTSLLFRHECSQRRTMRDRWRSRHPELFLAPNHGQDQALALVTGHLLPRILPRHALARVDSSIQSP